MVVVVVVVVIVMVVVTVQAFFSNVPLIQQSCHSVSLRLNT